MFVFVLLCITLCSFEFCNHLEEEEKAGCFVVIVLQTFCYYKYSMALPYGGCGWSAVSFVVFPDHTHLLFNTCEKHIKLKVPILNNNFLSVTQSPNRIKWFLNTWNFPSSLTQT